MSSYPQLPPPGFTDLSVEDQIGYVQALWDRIAAEPERVPLHDWQLKLIEERIADYKQNPASVEPWESVRARLLSKLSK